MDSATPLYDVIVVGCGPVGAYAANLLGAYGLNVVVVEKNTETYPLPRAVHIDHEMVRLLHQIGLTDDMMPKMREAQGHLHLGADGDVIRYMGSHGKPRRYAWGNDYFFFQPELEASLRAGIAQYPNVRLWQNLTVSCVKDTACGVSAQCEGPLGSMEFFARYLIACDGARSSVRKGLGILLEDLDFEEAWLVVDANVEGPIHFPPIPSLPEGADLQKLSVMSCSPKRPATIVPGRGSHRRWEFMLLPGEIETEMTSPATIHRLIDPWLEGCDYEIVRNATYRFHGLVAQRWQEGRVFLAGDAAHQTPPFFGQGMCHGMRDISNLGFKLKLVLQGKASPDILQSYQFEREAQVRHVIGAAVAAGRYICELDPEKAQQRDSALRQSQRDGRDIATAAELIAPYSQGLVAAGAGERFIQPVVRTKGGEVMRLDDTTPATPAFKLISRGEDGYGRLPQTTQTLLDTLETQRQVMGPAGDFVDLDGYLESEFDSRHAQYLLIRPDFYVFGWARDVDELNDLLIDLNAHLNPSTASSAWRLKNYV